MHLKINSISFSNLMSYGANETTFVFSNGICLIQGENGTGKSSMLEALTFCLYGKPYRSIKLDEMCNRKNKTGLHTKCNFSIGEDNYVLIRNRNPDKLKIEKNGNEIDLLSSKKLNNNEIEKIIGVSYETFKHTIAISISYNKPFLALDALSKRKLIEKMFGLEHFSMMNKILSDKNKTSKRNFDILENNISNIESTIKILKKQIVDLEEQNRNFEIENQEKINKHLQEISRQKTYLSDNIAEAEPYKTAIEKLKADVRTLDKPKYNTAKAKLEKLKSELEWNVRDLTNKIKKLTTETACPVCKTPFPEDKRLEEINNNSKSKIFSEEKIKEIDVKLETLLHNIEIIEKKETKVILQEAEYQKLQAEIKEQQKTIKTHETQIEELKSARTAIDIDKIRAQVADKEIELTTSTARKNAEEVNIKNYDTVGKILSDEGARSYIIDKIIPLINKKCNDYLEMFEIPIKITFDKYMEEKIISLEHFRQAVSYWSFSEGEKKRIDFSIMLALVETMKIVSNWFADVFIIDELLDNSVDVEGLEKMITTLKELSSAKGMGIFIISHRMNENFSTLFDHKICVKKNMNGFSAIQEEK